MGGFQILSVAIIVTYQVIFIQISINHDNISALSCWQEKVGFWPSIIHDNICSVIHKKYHTIVT